MKGLDERVSKLGLGRTQRDETEKGRVSLWRGGGRGGRVLSAVSGKTQKWGGRLEVDLQSSVRQRPGALVEPETGFTLGLGAEVSPLWERQNDWWFNCFRPKRPLSNGT